MRIFKKVIFMLILFLIGSYNTYALTGTVNVNTTLKLRSEPNTSSVHITSFYNGTILNILSDAIAGDGNCSNWYKVEYEGYNGYVCGDYIILNNNTNYNIEDDTYNKSNYDKPLSKDGSVMCYASTGDLNIRNAVGGSSTGAKLKCGEEVNIIEVIDTPLQACPYWYKVERNNDTGYVCGYYVNTTKLSNTAINYYNRLDLERTEAENNQEGNSNEEEGNSGEEENTSGDSGEGKEDSITLYKKVLGEAGFPESYHPYLLELHARHPNWNFVAELMPMSFEEAIIGESAENRNILQGSAFNSGYYSLASHTYNLFNNTYKTADVVDPNYYNASMEAIAYYMDPRNYLNEKYIFAFETLGYSSNQDSVVASIIAGQSFFDDIYKNTYTDGTGSASGDIVKASSLVGISAVHVASRIKQEMGTSLGISDSRLGGNFTYNGTSYNGYYNFFNIKSRCSNCSSIYTGYAYEAGWNTPYKGIYGGASFMYDGYISLNQDTIYYEKFDVSTSNGHYTHQYMQNLAAPIQEGGIKYKGYVDGLASYLETAITFVIPVYSDMPSYAVTAPKLGSNNNYLSDIIIDDKSVANFSYNTYNYDVYLSGNTTKVNIDTKKMDNSATITGSGNIEITSDKQTNQIAVISETGKVRTYTINFIREVLEETTVVEAMNNSGFKYNDKYLYGINIGTNVSELIGNITSFNHSVVVKITDKDGNIKTNDSFRTGDIILVSTNNETKEYRSIIFGDLDSNGLIDKKDLLAVQSKVFGYSNFDELTTVAADINKDGIVDKKDLLAFQSHVFGYSEIKQE